MSRNDVNTSYPEAQQTQSGFSATNGGVINSQQIINYFVDGKKLDKALVLKALDLGLTPLLTNLQKQYQDNEAKLAEISGQLAEQNRLLETSSAKDSTIASQQETIRLLLNDKIKLQKQALVLDDSLPQTIQASISILETCQAVADTPEFARLLSLIQNDNLADAQTLSSQISQGLEWKKTLQEMKTSQRLLGEKASSLAAPFYLAGNYSEAVTGYEEALNLYPDQAEALSNLSDAYTKLPKPEYKKAQISYDQAIALYEAIPQPSLETQAKLADVYASFARLWRIMGQAQTSIRYNNKALKIFLTLSGERHPSVASLYNNLGLAYRSLGDLKQAIEFYEKSLTISKAVYGEQHHGVALTYNNIGSVYWALGDFEQALSWFEKSIKISTAIFGEFHPDVARTYNNIGTVYIDLRDYPKAIECLEKSLLAKKTIYGEQHIEIADTYNNLGSVYQESRKYRQAIEWFEKSLAINQALFGEQHPKVALNFNNLGEAYRALGDPKYATVLYEKSVAISRVVYGEQHTDVARTYSNLGLAYKALNDTTNAKAFYLKAKAIQDVMLPNNHPDRIKTDNYLRDIGIDPATVTLAQLTEALNTPLPKKLDANE